MYVKSWQLFVVVQIVKFDKNKINEFKNRIVKDSTKIKVEFTLCNWKTKLGNNNSRIKNTFLAFRNVRK